MQLVLASSLPNGYTNADKSKNQINLRYYLVDGSTGQPISAELAADAINLLSVQDLAQYLGQEVVQQGYIEAQPRVNPSSADEKLWIIAAVLGPILVLILIIWIIICVYYKCINTSKRRLNSKSKSRIINSESPDTVRPVLEEIFLKTILIDNSFIISLKRTFSNDNSNNNHVELSLFHTVKTKTKMMIGIIREESIWSVFRYRI